MYDRILPMKLASAVDSLGHDFLNYFQLRMFDNVHANLEPSFHRKDTLSVLNEVPLPRLSSHIC